MEDAEMEGLTIDEPARKEIGLQLLSEKITAREDLNDMVGYEVNWNSPQQIARLLYEDLGLTCRVFTDGSGASLVAVSGSPSTPCWHTTCSMKT